MYFGAREKEVSKAWFGVKYIDIETDVNEDRNVALLLFLCGGKGI